MEFIRVLFRSRGDDRDILPVALPVGTPLLRGVEVEALDELITSAVIEAAAQSGEQVDRLTAGEARPQGHEIGRASCRQRGKTSRVAGWGKNKRGGEADGDWR